MLVYAERFYKHNLVARMLDARRSTLGGYHMPPKSRRWEIEEASRESIGRPFNGRPMAFSLFRDGPAFGQAGVFCNSESENSYAGTESWQNAEI